MNLIFTKNTAPDFQNLRLFLKKGRIPEIQAVANQQYGAALDFINTSRKYYSDLLAKRIVE